MSKVENIESYHVAKDLKIAYILGLVAGNSGWQIIDQDSTTVVLKNPSTGEEKEVCFK